MKRRVRNLSSLLVLLAGAATAQQLTDMQKILDRLEQLEQQNRQMLDEIRTLRRQLEAKSGAPAEETGAQTASNEAAIQERRVEELEQTKVEASQKMPIRLSGMLLFNAYQNSAGAGVLAETAPEYGRRSGGATLYQSIVGLDFDGPRTVWGARVHGDVRFQLFDYTSLYGPRTSGYQQPALRLRTGSIRMDWGSRSLMFGQEKPLVSTLNPDSLAQVGIPPLSGAGNLWIWQPQVRFEQKFTANDGHSTVRAQAALFSTSETSAYVPAALAPSIEATRPGWQGRIELGHQFSDNAYLRVAPVFHYSVSHVSSRSIESKLAGFDMAVRPSSWLELTGFFFKGQNIANLGSLGQGYTFHMDGSISPVHATGGWGQVAITATQRLSFHLFAGVEGDRARDLYQGIGRNMSYAGNVYYRIGPNVFVSAEAAQIRTRSLDEGEYLRNQYDLALAYLF